MVEQQPASVSNSHGLKVKQRLTQIGHDPRDVVDDYQGFKPEGSEEGHDYTDTKIKFSRNQAIHHTASLQDMPSPARVEMARNNAALTPAPISDPKIIKLACMLNSANPNDSSARLI